LDQDVVDAHGHQVDADGVVPAELLAQLELGATPSVEATRTGSA
jgi:hypothetical protein